MTRSIASKGVGLAVAVCLAAVAGCHSAEHHQIPNAPRELFKVTQPPYVVEPPDILLIDAVRVVPLPPYKINPLDQLIIQSPDALPTDPIAGIYPVDPEGTVNLGLVYGAVSVVDLTTEQAQVAIAKHLGKILKKDPTVTVSLAQSRASQQIRGEHLVRPDGTVALGLYGSVQVAGMTLEGVKAAVEEHLSRFIYKPEVSVDVAAYNSKVYYVISDGAGAGEQVVRLPSTGNETVLDAIGNVGGLSTVASRKRIWVSRPAPAGCGPDQILPVEWKNITRLGQTATNYQLMPGDRLYVMAQPWITLDTHLGRFYAPIEKTFGILLLAQSTVQTLANGQQGGIGGGF